MSQIVISASVPASRGRVWQVVSDLQNLHLFHPYVEEADVIGDRARGVGVERVCYLYDGTEQLEQMTQWVEGTGFTAKILESKLPFEEAKYTLRIAPHGPDRCTVDLDLRYRLRGGLLGRWSDALMWKNKIGEAMSRVLRGLSIHAGTGVRIGPNGDVMDVTHRRPWRRVEPSFKAAVEPTGN